MRAGDDVHLARHPSHKFSGGSCSSSSDCITLRLRIGCGLNGTDFCRQLPRAIRIELQAAFIPIFTSPMSSSFTSPRT